MPEGPAAAPFVAKPWPAPCMDCAESAIHEGRTQMKRLVLAGALVLASAPFGAVLAEDDADSADIVILAVAPRSPDVKPVIMTVPAPRDSRAARSETTPAPAIQRDAAVDSPAQAAIRR